MAIRPLRATYNPSAPFVIERHDCDDGSIDYEIWDKRPDSYRRLCTVYENAGRSRAQARKDADLIVRSLNSTLSAWDKVTERARHAYRMDAKAVIDAAMLVEAIENIKESPPQ